MSTRRRLTASQWFAISVAALLFVGVLGTVASVLAIAKLGDARVELTEKLSPAAIASSDLKAGLLNQETGVRGFTLGGEDRFLDPYNTGRRETEEAIARLRRLTDEDGVSRFRPSVETVVEAVRAWETGYAEPTIALVRRDPEAARQPSAVGSGKARFDAFRAELGRLQSGLLNSRDEASDRLDQNADIVLSWVLGTGIVVLLSVAGVALILRSKIVRPLQQLAVGARTVSRGDFDHEIQGTGAREVVDLGEDVDAMRSRIVAELGAVRDAQADLKRSNAELEQFAYVASHDLQEPLRKVASFCQLLQQRYGGQLDARADQYIGFAVDGARRMQDLINDLLSFSRVGRLETPFTDVDCELLMSGVRTDLGRAIEESGAEIISGPMPTVRGDAGLLRVVFQNLCANAIKFRDEAAPIIHFDAEREDAFWRFRCADNGIGIDPEYEERIFVLFQRLHPRTQYEGTGIGLAMCRKIVEFHGGRMWLETGEPRDGGGSTFYFTLPADEPEN